MTKWARIRKRKERKRAEEALTRDEAEGEVKLTEPEKISENIQRSHKTVKPESTKTFKPNTILAQIPRYAYLLTIFALLSGVFFPLITPGISFDHVIQGTAVLFLGLVGGILLFKTVTSDKKRIILIAVGFAMIAVSLVLLYQIRDAFTSLYF